MVALSASRLVWPAIAWIRPITSPMRVAAVASCDMVSTVRCASVTARLATSVEVAAWPAISPIEAASSSAELAAAATFIEAAPTRSSAALDSAETASAAPLSVVDGGLEPFARRRAPSPSASSTVLSKPAIVAGDRLGAALALAHGFLLRHRRAARARARCRGTRSRCAPSRRSRPWRRSRGCRPRCRRSASCSIAPESSPSGLVMLRPMNQLSSQAEQHDRDADGDDQHLGCACEVATSSAAAPTCARRMR